MRKCLVRWFRLPRAPLSSAQMISPSRMASVTRRRFASAPASVSRCLKRLRLRETRRAPELSISRSARKPSYFSSKSQSALSNAAARRFRTSGAILGKVHKLRVRELRGVFGKEERTGHGCGSASSQIKKFDVEEEPRWVPIGEVGKIKGDRNVAVLVDSS